MAKKPFDAILFTTGLAALAMFMVVLLIVAGRPGYWQAWSFGLVNLLFLTVVSAVFAGSGNLFRERFRPGPGAKGWDRALWLFFGPANLAILIVAALDAGRFRWTSGLPLAAYLLGHLGYVCGGGLHLWSVRQNPHYVSTVGIREKQGQSVIDGGPYRLVRHPGYTGIILMVNGMAIILGSAWALIPSGGSTLLLILRTILEDRALQRELNGYQEYAKRVRNRLWPGVW